MIDNPSNPPNPGVTRRAPRNRIWKDPSFWKGFLLGTGKDNVSICPIPKNFGIGFGRALSPIPLPILSQKKHTTLALSL